MYFFVRSYQLELTLAVDFDTPLGVLMAHLLHYLGYFSYSLTCRGLYLRISRAATP